MSRLWRILTGVLVAVAGASLLLILLVVYLATDPPVGPQALVEMVVLLALLPWLTAWALRRAARGKLEVSAGTLALERRDLRLEVPADAVAAVVPWLAPLPGPGLWLRLRSGRKLRYGMQTPELSALVAALAQTGVAGAAAAARHPSVVYAAAKAARAGRWYRGAGKFVVFGLLPAAIFFNAHQHIAYGGTLGEYYLLGLRSYLTTFGVYWMTMSIYLVLYASLWRALAEGVALAAAWLRPARAESVRRAVEIACSLLYYGGVPVLVALRFLA